MLHQKSLGPKGCNITLDLGSSSHTHFHKGGAGLQDRLLCAFLPANTGILVYTDGSVGAGETCVAMTLASLKKAVSSLQTNCITTETQQQPYLVEMTTSDEIIQGQWTNTCNLLVMPGGRDLPYVASLQGRGNKAIKTFVQGGGSYLGICAGGYYAASFVEFAKGDPVLEVVGLRELKFFPGTAQGPMFPGFEYDSNAGAKAAAMLLSQHGSRLVAEVWSTTVAAELTEPFPVFYNGGCRFIPKNQLQQKAQTAIEQPSNNSFEVLATYNTENASGQAAIIACRFGKGKVILSGVHLESSAQLLRTCYPGDAHVQTLLPQIAAADSCRETLFNSLVKYLLTS